MKKILSVALVTASLLTTMLGPVSAFVEVNRTCTNIFSDVTTGNTLCPYVEYLYVQGVVKGYSDGKFHPNDIVTRGQFAKMTVNAFQLGLGAGEASFPDVPKTHVFYNEIMTLKSLGIINGYSDGTFRPDAPVTRGAALKFIENAVAQKNASLFPNTDIKISGIFKDVPDAHAFASYIARAYSVSDPDLAETIVGGYSDGTFKPDLGMTRAQVAKVLTNSMKYSDLSKLTCLTYFCQDITGKADGVIDGTYYKVDYDNSFWTVELENAPEVLGSLENGTPGQTAFLLSESRGYSSAIFMAMDLKSPNQPANTTLEQAMASLAQSQNKTVNQYFGEIVLQEMKDNNSTFGGAPMTVKSQGLATNGMYSVAFSLNNYVADGQTMNASGYLELGLKGNIMFVNVVITDNDVNLTNLSDVLSKVTYK